MPELARVDPDFPTRSGTAAWHEPGILLCYAPIDQSPAAIRAFYRDIRREVDATSGRFVMITDTRHLQKMPDALARRVHGECAKALMVDHEHRRVSSITIVESALIRATITAIRWLLGENKVPSLAVETLEEALRVARQKL